MSTQAEAVPDLVTALQAALDDPIEDHNGLRCDFAYEACGGEHIVLDRIAAALAAARTPAPSLDVEDGHEHVIMRVDRDARDAVRRLLSTVPFIGVGYSEFLHRAVAALTPATPFEYGGALANQRFPESPSPSEPPGLDVERLARAIAAWWVMDRPLIPFGATMDSAEVHMADAKLIAAEYARLRSESPDSEPRHE